jgi:hypothetical protein
VLSKIFKSLYNKVFVNIVVERSKTNVYVEVCNKKSVLNNYSESFDTLSVNKKMHEYINSYISESPFNYISILDTSPSQGAIPTCSAREMSVFYNLESSKYMCYKNQWAYYTSKPNLKSLQENYSKIGIDFVFSPFVILSNFFKDKIDTNLALYILMEDNYITVSVFDNSKLLFGEHIDMQHGDGNEELIMDENSEDDIDLDLEGSINLEDIDAISDIDGLDDFADIEDLDTIDDIDEFAESDDEEEFSDAISETASVDTESFNEDYHRFSLIQSSINRFYKDLRYESKFVESIYVADGIGVSGDLKRYLEEEMFLNVYVRHVDLCAEVCEIAKAELK